MGLWTKLIWILSVICAIWVIVEVITKHKHWSTLKKVVWIVLAIIPGLAILTAIVYYFTEYKKR